MVYCTYIGRNSTIRHSQGQVETYFLTIQLRLALGVCAGPGTVTCVKVISSTTNTVCLASTDECRRLSSIVSVGEYRGFGNKGSWQTGEQSHLQFPKYRPFGTQTIETSSAPINVHWSRMLPIFDF